MRAGSTKSFSSTPGKAGSPRNSLRSRKARFSISASQCIDGPARNAQAVGDEGGGERHLRQHRARGGRGRREDLGAEEGEAQGGADLRLVAAEIAARDQASRRLLAFLDGARDLAAIEAVLAAVADRRERLRQVGLTEDRADDGHRAVGKEDARGRRIFREPRAIGRDRLGDVPRSSTNPSRASLHGRLDARLSRAAFPRGGARGPARDRARNARGERALGRGRRAAVPGAARKRSRRAARGAVSRKSTVRTRPFASREIQNPPPPMLPASGHVTARANATATAASAALPPRLRISMPTPAAIPSSAATAPPAPFEAWGRSAADSAAEAKSRSSAESRRYHCAILPAR